ncbi:MAG: helix-turn-helix transcriptional regulator [Gammaproteobacteria bacterium]|nr:helix-turn-helix transcriptional regulator [Gammaproteobacteria bacterium]
MPTDPVETRATPPRTTPDVDAYIGAIGERVRGMRARRGMTRKQLGEDSGVSERYLAQLEGGKANVSIGLLWQIAQAMGVPPHELLPDASSHARAPSPLLQFLDQLTPDQEQAAHALLLKHFVNPDGDVRGVALIGLRGAGKSTLGEKLAEAVGVPFIRIGDVVEQLGGMSIAEIFSLGGQTAYRRLEREALQHVLDNYETSVIEAGGSLVSEPATYAELLGSFYTVWVRAAPEEHMTRVVVQGDLRPVQASQEAMDDLKRILTEREPEYRAANYTLDTSGRDVEACLDELMDMTRCYLCRWGADHPRSKACGQRPLRGTTGLPGAAAETERGK